MSTPQLTLTTVNLNASDANRLGRFYADLLNWPIVDEDRGWVLLRPEGGGVGLSAEQDDAYQPPTWPSEQGKQIQMLHLEIKVDDLDAAVAHATSLGARVAAFQPNDTVRVCLDPDGHPFCLWTED